MHFTLTYEGSLSVGKKSVTKKKHAIREIFHRQLERLWRVNPFLANWRIPTDDPLVSIRGDDWLGKQTPKIGGVSFIPLVSSALSIDCALKFRVLRPTDKPGQVSDIDNQIKVLIDALKAPAFEHEVPKELHGTTGVQFYVLLEDDRLISSVTSKNDELLHPICEKEEFEPQDVRILCDVLIRPQIPLPINSIFYSDQPASWDHMYDTGIPEKLTDLSDRELKSVASQCILRIRALADCFTRNRLDNIETLTSAEFRELGNDDIRSSLTHSAIWQNNLWPKAIALKIEMSRRLNATPTEESRLDSLAIDTGMLTGPSPLSEAANYLESLVRRLP